MSEDVKTRMDADVARLVGSGGDPLCCVFDAQTAIALANAILALGSDVSLIMRDGLAEDMVTRTRYLGAKNTTTGEVEWFNYSQFCPPRPPEDCE